MTTANEPSRRPKALLLDHDAVMLRLLGTTLEARGFDVRAATDGQSGLDLLLDELLELDVVVMADDLPGRDGRSLLRLLRAGGERELGVVVLAARDGSASRTELWRLGADAVLDRADGPRAAAHLVEALAGAWLAAA